MSEANGGTFARAVGDLYTRIMASGAPSPAEVLAAERVSLVRTGDGPGAAWSAEVTGMPGCTASAATPEEAVRLALAAAEASSEAPTPPSSDEPRTDAAAATHSGRLLVRMPATLHDRLAHAAKAEGVSLNQFITGVLASAVEWRGSRAKQGEDDSSPRLTARSVRVALVANLAAVVLATLVAITLLVAWQAGW